MRIHFSLGITLLALPYLLCSAAGSELKTRLVAKDIQRSEEIVAVAVKVGDVIELKRQADMLLLLPGRIPDSEEMGARVSCTAAAQALRNAANDLSEVGQARKIVSAKRELRLYTEAMEMCEVDTGLAQPSDRSLRAP